MYLLKQTINMKNKSITHTKIFSGLFATLAVTALLFATACSDDNEPKKEDTPELITKATLTFTPAGGGPAVVVSATDPDGEGVQDIKVDGNINLAANQTYTMTIALINELASPTEDGYNISEEVEDEGAEHIFFFEWSGNLFADPTGNGNMDNRADELNYNDMDENNLPIGLSTTWTTGGTTAGTFNIILKHQPGVKSATSTVAAGESDLDVEFLVIVQ
jgi:hypothetical protein